MNTPLWRKTIIFSASVGMWLVASTGWALQGADYRYRDLPVTCRDEKDPTKFNAYAPCPGKPAPMKKTEKKTFNQLSPLLYLLPIDMSKASTEDKKGKPYSGPWARGTGLDATNIYQMTGDSQAEGIYKGSREKRPACVDILDLPPKDPKDLTELATIQRLKFGHCAMQYILWGSAYPDYRANSTTLSGENPSDPSERTKLTTHGQPLKVRFVRDNYDALHYYKIAWEKVMSNPAHRSLSEAKDTAFSKAGERESGFPPDMKPYKKQIPLPPNPTITLDAIAANQEGSGSNYEMIVDPTHLWTPRWDFRWVERDEYSPKTATYSLDTTNSVYCAGNRANGVGGNKRYLVDVLEYRREKFEEGMVKNRIKFNEMCFNDRNNRTGTVVDIAATSYCYMPLGVMAQAIPCFQCFGLTPGIKLTQFQDSPCATRHDGEDIKVKPPYLPGFMNTFDMTAHCSKAPGLPRPQSASVLCKDLRAPFNPINLLKMRKHTAGDPLATGEDELPSGAPESYTFKEHFGDHMPYPRLWDTGQSIQDFPSDDQDPFDIQGQFTAIVGAGREAVTEEKTNSSALTSAGAYNPPTAGSLAGGGTPANKSSGTSGNRGESVLDERCLMDGWGEDASAAGLTFKKGDPMTSTIGTLLYQGRAQREGNLTTMPRYAKSYDSRSAEAQLLKRGSPEATLVMACKKSPNGGVPSCRYISDDPPNPPQPDEVVQYKTISIPPAYRGTISDPDPETRFPHFGAEGGKAKGIYVGLDNAQCGDIILMPHGAFPKPKSAKDKVGLPKIARVIGVNLKGRSSCKFDKAKDATYDCGEHCYVDVEEADSGKWPDVCGSTEVAGSIQKRRLFQKKSNTGLEDEMKRIEWFTDCGDSALNECTFNPALWGEVEIYRPSEDIRKGDAV